MSLIEILVIVNQIRFRFFDKIHQNENGRILKHS